MLIFSAIFSVKTVKAYITIMNELTICTVMNEMTKCDFNPVKCVRILLIVVILFITFFSIKGGEEGGINGELLD